MLSTYGSAISWSSEPLFFFSIFLWAKDAIPHTLNTLGVTFRTQNIVSTLPELRIDRFVMLECNVVSCCSFDPMVNLREGKSCDTKEKNVEQSTSASTPWQGFGVFSKSGGGKGWTWQEQHHLVLASLAPRAIPPCVYGGWVWCESCHGQATCVERSVLHHITSPLPRCTIHVELPKSK